MTDKVLLVGDGPLAREAATCSGSGCRGDLTGGGRKSSEGVTAVIDVLADPSTGSGRG